MYSIYQKIGLWITALILAVLGPVVAFFVYLTNADWTEVMNRGKIAMANIEKVDWETRRNTREDYRLWIAFATEKGSPSKQELIVDSETGENARSGKIDKIEVKYLPENPEILFPANADKPSDGGIYVGIVMFVAGIGLMILLRRMNDRPHGAVEEVEMKIG